jgi:c-di-GMP-related signal transduction protein
LSLLDSMLGSPWRSLISSLPLRAEMVRALSDREGDLGRILLAVELYEAGTPPEKEASFLSLAKGFWEGAAYSRKTMLALRQFAD